ncbi:hypothetical protein BH10PSE12_BH10PSE12_16940 [soil metagenome]
MLAIFVPAWHEAYVIGAMLRSTLNKWNQSNYQIFVGVYPNDPATNQAVTEVMISEPRVVIALTDQPGPTTKADCLNILWHAMLEMEKLYQHALQSGYSPRRGGSGATTARPLLPSRNMASWGGRRRAPASNMT